MRLRVFEPPNLQLRHDAHRAAEFQQRAVALAGLAQVETRNGLGPGRRRSDPPAAKLRDGVHVVLHLLDALGPLSVVVNDPRGEADRALDREPAVGDEAAKVLERLACVGVLLDAAEPGLDAGVAGLGGDLDLLGDRQFEAHQGARVQTKAQRRFVGRGLRLRGRGDPAQGRSPGRPRPKRSRHVGIVGWSWCLPGVLRFTASERLARWADKSSLAINPSYPQGDALGWTNGWAFGPRDNHSWRCSTCGRRTAKVVPAASTSNPAAR